MLALHDTTTVKTTRPSKEKEEVIFSDRKLKYKRQVETGPGIVETLLQELAVFLFNSAGTENLLRTRQIIIWTVVVISLLVIARLLARSNFGRLTKPGAKSTGFNFNDVTEDLDTINYSQRIAEAISGKDYRLAIRWHYLEMLYELDKKQLIVFAPHKTNIDYRYELKNKGPQAIFFTLSRIYDYVWYGQFVINENDYLSNADSFLNLKKQLHV